MASNILDLPAEILLYVFDFCDVYDLCRLRQCCRRFNDILKYNRINYREQNALVTNLVKSPIRNRTLLRMNPLDKLRISHYWRIGKYKLSTTMYFERNLPWLCLNDQQLWVSREKKIEVYQRIHNTRKSALRPLERSPEKVLQTEDKNDIIRFRLKDNFIISCKRDGGISIWSLEDKHLILNALQSHRTDVNDVDITQDIYVSGSSDFSYTIWKLDESGFPNRLHNEYLGDKVWCLGISPQKRTLAIGITGLFQLPPFRIYDLESYNSMLSLKNSFKKGAGTMDLQWHDENTVLTCGYDSYLRKFDLRVGQCVQEWSDPDNCSLYCLQTDNNFSILCGTNMYGRVVLWDQRISRKYVQMYYTLRTGTSPVYSLAFDGSQLFVALATKVACLDFTFDNSEVRNYATDALHFY